MGNNLGNSSSIPLTSEEIDVLVSETYFNAEEIVKLYRRYRHIDRQKSGNLRKIDFNLIPELAMNPLFNRILAIFHDYGPVNFITFVKVLHIFHPLCPLELKLKLIFRAYDIDNDGIISLDDLCRTLKLLGGTYLTDEQTKMIATQTIAQSDDNNKGYLTFQDFKNCIGTDEYIRQNMSINMFEE